jgi:uncharacterized protein
MRQGSRWFATLGIAALAVGCATSPKSSFYILEATVPSPGATASDYSVGIAAVNLPERVDRPQLVLRVGANRVELVEEHRWAEPLRSNLGQVVAENLSRRLGQSRVAAYPHGTTTDPDYWVRIDVQIFESQPGDAATLEALWSVQGTRGGVARTGRTLAREAAAPGYDALVAAHSHALARLSADIATALLALRQASPGTVVRKP